MSEITVTMSLDEYHIIMKKVKVFKEMFEEIKKVEMDYLLPDGDNINVPTALWLEDLIKTFEDTSEKETK